ncbi:MAG: amidohydrolase family protein [Acidimicrobiia bacterium]
MTIVDDRYTIISADCHAGASIETYGEYLDPAYREAFAEWRGAYVNPFRDLQGDSRTRNWDDDRRIADLEADGQVGEVAFPNTVPPFFPTGALVARPPTREDLDARWAGLHAHNRWLVDWCAGQSARRAGIAQVFLNDPQRAVQEAEWVSEQGLRGGILIPEPPDDTDIEPLYSPVYDDLWQVCEERKIVVNHHGGTGHPDYGPYPAAPMMWVAETAWYSHRVLWQLLMSGVFERFPKLKFVLTETGCSWIRPTLAQLDMFHHQGKLTGRAGEFKLNADAMLELTPSEYFQRNIWVGVSFPSPYEAKAMRKLGLHKVMWGSDYPHFEGTTPHSRESLQRSFHEWTPEELDQVFCGNVSEVYGFEPAALADRVAECGFTVDELSQPLETVPHGARSPAFY